MAKPLINTSLLLFLMLSGALFQFGVPLTRIATTYKALAGGMEGYFVGTLSAAFTLLPVFFTVIIGRLNDRGNVGMTIFAGGVLIVLATAAMWLLPPSIPVLLAGTIVLGIGQTLGLSGLQFSVTRVSSSYHRDAVLGNYMMVMSLGGGLGPLLIGFVGSNDASVIADRLMMITTALAVVAVVVVFLVSRKLARRPGSHASEPVTLGEILATKGVMPLLIASGLLVAAQDLVLVFMPVVGIERAISVAVVGYLITTRSVFSVASRFFYGRLSRWLGRRRLVVISIVASAAGFAMMAGPVPLLVMFLAMALVGVGLGVGSTASVSLMLLAAPIHVRATALSLRLTANRIGQFVIPLAATPVAVLSGVGGIFAVLAAMLLASGLHVHFSIKETANKLR